MIRSNRLARRLVAGAGLFALVNFPELPDAPAPPETVWVDLFVWNASKAAAKIEVTVDEQLLFSDVLEEGKTTTVAKAIELVEGEHQAQAAAGPPGALGEAELFSISVAPDGNRWLVVSWWGDDLEAAMRRQPPWITDS